jgi:hypothetical protein
LCCLHEDDANTMFFQRHTNHRHCKTHIESLEVNDVTLRSEPDKAVAVFDFLTPSLGQLLIGSVLSTSRLLVSLS